MKDLIKILKWFERNMFKLIFIPICIIIIYTIVMFLIPFYQFVGFIGDGFNDIQNIFQEMEKHIEEFEWEKKVPSSLRMKI